MKEMMKERLMPSDVKDDNTYLLDTESSAEMARLINQERLLTQAMDGPLAQSKQGSKPILNYILTQMKV